MSQDPTPSNPESNLKGYPKSIIMKLNWRSESCTCEAKFAVLLFISFIFLQTEAQEINLTGKVVDNNSEPVPSVTISLETARISTVTNGVGDFSLIGSATGLPDLMRKGKSRCSFDGRRLFISSMGATVSISIYDLSGRLHSHILKPSHLNGEYMVYPSAYISSERSHIYILRVSMEMEAVSYKLVHYNDLQYSKGVWLIKDNKTPGESRQSRKSTNSLDSLVFTHDFYMTKKLPISEYVADVGTVQLEDSLIEISAPGSLSAYAVSAKQIDLEWTDNSDNEYGFRVERSSDGTDDWRQVARLGANTTRYQDSTLLPSRSYFYRVYAYWAGSKSPYSNIATATTSALDYCFNGGDLADLRAVSPELVFGDLSIDGNLYLGSSDTSIVFTVENMRINAQVKSPYPFILYDPGEPAPVIHAPDLTINATGGIWVNAPMLLHGWWGASIPPEAVFVHCQGTDGGDLTLYGANIYINNYIHTYGGDGGYAKSEEGVLFGCHAGNGGDISFYATDSLYISAPGSNLNLAGGKAVDSTSIRGNDGMDGIPDFEGREITVEEINLGSAEENMYDYKAQLLEYEKMTVYGHCAFREEHEHRNDDGTWYRYLGFANVDWIEDIYLLYHTGGPININLNASEPAANLDIFLTTTSGIILDSGKGPTSTESIAYEQAGPGYYWIWVSYYDYGPEGSTDYTLRFKP